jgi:4-oxalocrotonate tautomerase
MGCAHCAASGMKGRQNNIGLKGAMTMPIVQIELLQGRTTEQKRLLVEKVTEAIVGSVNCPREAVSIIIREMSPDNYANAGVLRIDRK